MSTKTKIPSALRFLHKYGVDALKPTKIINTSSQPTPATTSNNITNGIFYHPINQRQRWKKPKVSKRVANTLRKKAIREGTYGSYDPMTGIGWDVTWDTALLNKNNNHNSNNNNDNQSLLNNGNIPWMELRPHKEPKRERTREARAKKIEDLLTVADDKILDYRIAQREKKPDPGIETLIKKMMKDSRK